MDIEQLSTDASIEFDRLVKRCLTMLPWEAVKITCRFGVCVVICTAHFTKMYSTLHPASQEVIKFATAAHIWCVPLQPL